MIKREKSNFIKVLKLKKKEKKKFNIKRIKLYL